VGFEGHVIYRDHRLSCPRCREELDRRTRRDAWRCRKCGGVALELSTLLRRLHHIAPELVPRGGIDGVFTPSRRSATRKLPCAACGRAMRPVSLQDVELDRCHDDDLIWFEADALDRVLDAVIERHDAERGWLQRLRDFVFAN
jgi:Zn-finger nucleic acid-binding protein